MPVELGEAECFQAMTAYGLFTSVEFCCSFAKWLVVLVSLLAGMTQQNLVLTCDDARPSEWSAAQFTKHPETIRFTSLCRVPFTVACL